MSTVWSDEDPGKPERAPLTGRALVVHATKSAVLMAVLIPVTIVITALVALPRESWWLLGWLVFVFHTPVMAMYAVPFGVILGLLIGSTGLGPRRSWTLATSSTVCAVAVVCVLVLLTVTRDISLNWDVGAALRSVPKRLVDRVFRAFLWLMVPTAAIGGLYMGAALWKLRRASAQGMESPPRSMPTNKPGRVGAPRRGR